MEVDLRHLKWCKDLFDWLVSRGVYRQLNGGRATKFSNKNSNKNSTEKYNKI